MKEVVLTYPTSDGYEEIRLSGSKLSFGRGSEADQRLDDDGLSRIHATIYAEGDDIWIVDENSTNGTFVNGERVHPGGTPLKNGDRIKIGNYTNLKVRFVEEQNAAPSVVTGRKLPSEVTSISSDKPNNLATLIPVVAIAVAFFIISVSAVFVAFKIFSKPATQIVMKDPDRETPEEDPGDNIGVNDDKTPNPTDTKSTVNASQTPPASKTDVNSSNSTETAPASTPSFNLSGKKYLQLSEPDKNKYIEVKLKKIAGIIGNRASDDIPVSAIERIKRDVTGYANRLNKPKKPGTTCQLGDNLQTTFERASKNAGFISRAFVQEGIDGQVGIYVAMIESEHCPCVQSGTGPLGMFQFAYAAATEFFENPNGIVKGAKPPDGDDRCKPEIAARGAARYVKYLMGWFGTGPASVPLAIASYNSGQGAMRKNLLNALSSDPSLSRDFWTLIANTDKLTQQFQDENFKYPPKFFAAAIVGENPQDFGLNLQPLSLYTK